MAMPDLLQALFDATLAGSAASVAVLVLRRPLRRAFGATVAYGAWALVPAAMIAVLLPAPTQPTLAMPAVRMLVGGIAQVSTTSSPASVDWRMGFGVAWVLGALATVACFARQQHAFRKRLGALQRRSDGLYQAQAVDGLPAAIGLWKPLVVLPADFDNRYAEQQRALMIAHERMHVVHGDLYANAFATGIRCVFWFNPLLHVAARHFRHDQELACDLRVISRDPGARREYGEAMFKTQITQHALPLGCHWGSHPLKERIAMLKQPVPSPLRWMLGGALVATLTFGAAVTAWAAQADANHVKKTISIHFVDASLRDAAQQVADASGLRLLNPEVLQSSKRFTFELDNEPVDKLLSSLGDATGFVPLVANGEVRFVHVTEVVSVGPMPPPTYPAQALQGGIDGHVMLQIDVGADGKPTHVQVASAQPAGVFDQASLDAATRWTFQARRENGRAVASRIMVPVVFKAAN